MAESCPEQYVRCLKCLKIIKCSRYDTSSLVDHIQADHPEIIQSANEKLKNLHKLAAQHGVSEERLSQISKMTGMSESELADEAEKYIARNYQGGAAPATDPIKACAAPTQTSSSCKEPKPKLSASKDNNRRKYYRASIEKWTPTDGCIYCPSCGCNRRPMIKTNTEVYSSSSCCASCVASCWPFCFLPCLISPENKEYLHCANCKTFLGLYDRENNCIKPNREFVPCDTPCNGDCKNRPKKNQ
ncbi:uncharacterized protein LOC115634001 [Scaptodrosophila lebanonensis]|uniref:Uncharacterized protein LOC115634001 n=1 Tax=Drosophila lebanonensis TaxID=7225 RepID=A0A6J2UG09_DROLE|nr:uncharacterized protein LOC115634001 [Scaptodrosophila lebanonensis]